MLYFFRINCILTANDLGGSTVLNLKVSMNLHFKCLMRYDFVYTTDTVLVKMKSSYLPLDVFTALTNNPNISIKEIEALANVTYKTAARFKSNYNKYCEKSINVHHIKNKINIGNYRKVNKQYEKLKIFLDYVLNNEGFDSSQTLMNSFYKENPEFKNQQDRNFRRYFKKYRDSIEPTINKLEAYKSKEQSIGFCTRPNPRFRPTDN